MNLKLVSLDNSLYMQNNTNKYYPDKNNTKMDLVSQARRGWGNNHVLISTDYSINTGYINCKCHDPREKPGFLTVLDGNTLGIARAFKPDDMSLFASDIIVGQIDYANKNGVNFNKEQCDTIILSDITNSEFEEIRSIQQIPGFSKVTLESSQQEAFLKAKLFKMAAFIAKSFGKKITEVQIDARDMFPKMILKLA